MCRPIDDAATQIQKARDAMLCLQSVFAKHNASIRVRYPPSHAIRKTVENTLSGAINDVPFAIHVFALCGEDAACLCDDPLGCDPLDIFREGMGKLIDDARIWAGRPMISDTAVPIYPKTVSMVEEHLFTEIRSRAREFFSAIYAIPCVETRPLPKAEAEFWSKYRRAAAALARAAKDKNAVMRSTLSLNRKLPLPLAQYVISYLV